MAETVAPPEVTEVLPGVTRIAMPVPGIRAGVNVHLVRGDGPTTLVDTGMPALGGPTGLAEGLAAAGSSIEEIELVLLTHHHLDHTGLAAEVRERSGAPLAGLPAVLAAVEDADGTMRGEIAWGEEHLGRHGASPDLLGVSRGIAPLLVGGPPAADGRALAEGDVVAAGDLRLTVRHRPGHSATDTLLVEADPPAGRGPVAFVGDHVFAGAPLTPVLGSMHREEDRPAATYLRALEETARIPGLLALTGHGPPLDDVPALLATRRGALERRTGRVRDALTDEPTGTWELGLVVWRGVPAARHGLTRLAALLASLELLEDAGDAVRGRDGDRVVWSRAPGAAGG